MDYCQLALYQLTQYQACQGQLDKQMMILEQYANMLIPQSKSVAPSTLALGEPQRQHLVRV